MACQSCSGLDTDVQNMVNAMSGMVGGLVRNTRQQEEVCGPSQAFGSGWDTVMNEAACFRTNRQRFLGYSKIAHGTFVNPAAAGTVDVLPNILAATGLPTATGNANGIDFISMADQQGEDIGPLDGLAIVAMAVFCCVGFVDAQAPNPTGGAGAISSYSNFEALQTEACCRIYNSLDWQITHRADQDEFYVFNTNSNYFSKGQFGYVAVPPMVFREKESERVKLVLRAPDFGGAAFQLFVPENVRMTLDFHMMSLWLNDPRCGCEWPFQLCGNPNSVYDPDVKGTIGQSLLAKGQKLLPQSGSMRDPGRYYLK